MTSRAILNGWPIGIGRPRIPTGPITPAPLFTTPPSISPASGTAGSVFTANDGVVTGGTIVSRQWRLSGSAIGTGTTITPSAGSLVLRVTAVGEGGTTVQDSAAVTVTSPNTAPAAPTITATSGTAQNTITFTDNATGGSPITARKLYRSTTSGFTPGAGNLIQTNPTSPFTDTGLTNGTTYYYKGIATNAIGDSPASAEVSAAPTAPVTTATATTPPSIDGQPIDGTSVALNVGAWDGDYASFDVSVIDETDAVIVARQAVTSTTNITLNNVSGKTLRLRVWAINSGGSTTGTATSAPFGPIQSLTHVMSIVISPSGTNAETIPQAISPFNFTRVAGANGGVNLYSDTGRNSNPNSGMSALKHGFIGSNPAAATFGSTTLTPPDFRFAMRPTSFPTDPTIVAYRIDVPTGGSNTFSVFGASGRAGAATTGGFRVYDGIPGAGGTLVATVASGSTGAAERIRDATTTIYNDTTAFSNASQAGGAPIDVTITSGILVIAPSASSNTALPNVVTVLKKP